MTADSPDLDRLDALARAATEGPWAAATTGVRNGDHWSVVDSDRGDVRGTVARIPSQDGTNDEQRQPDAEFIAATDPPTVLALIAELRQARADRDAALAKVAAVERLVDEWGDEQPWVRKLDLRDALAGIAQ